MSLGRLLDQWLRDLVVERSLSLSLLGLGQGSVGGWTHLSSLIPGDLLHDHLLANLLLGLLAAHEVVEEAEGKLAAEIIRIIINTNK